MPRVDSNFSSPRPARAAAVPAAGPRVTAARAACPPTGSRRGCCSSGAGVQVPIVNPGFETLDKPGSTTVTATLPAGSATASFGPGAAVTGAGGAPTALSFSDGTTGTTADVPGWTVSPGTTADVENDSTLFPVKSDNFAHVRPDPDPSGPNPFITQTLTGFSLKPNTTYVLTFDTGTENQTSPNGGPISGNLLVNGTAAHRRGR